MKQLIKIIKNTVTKLLILSLITMQPGLVQAVGGQASSKTTYYIPDAIGSPIAAMDEVGNVIWRKHYRPYGEEIENTAEELDASKDNRIGYTGHVHDSDTGLTYMGARYYDPMLGRFMGMDPVGFTETNPLSMNRYAYGNNSPYRYVDPDGRESQEALYEMLGIPNPNANLTARAKAVAGGANTIAEVGDAVASDPTTWVPGVVGIKLLAVGMLGVKGQKIFSQTVWKSKGKDRGRIDVENPNPGVRSGQIHYQEGQNKYIYDPETNSFPDAPKAINDKLLNDDFKKGIDKGLKYLGED